MNNIKIGSFSIGKDEPPFIIAELSGNHNQNLTLALDMVDAAADAGVHALKLQTYTADTMTIDIKRGEFFIDDKQSLWQGHSLYELYEKAHTPWEWHKAIFERAKERGMVAFSTPFDATSVDFLETLEVPCYKIASFENTDQELIAKVAKTGKPIILSTGMASLTEIAEAVEVLERNDCQEYILLKCTSQYPADPINAGGVDAAFSLEADEFALLVNETRRARVAIGKISYGCTESEINSRKLRRSLYIVKDVKEGEILTRENVRAIRPGLGLPVKHLKHILGKQVCRSVKGGSPLSWSIIR